MKTIRSLMPLLTAALALSGCTWRTQQLQPDVAQAEPYCRYVGQSCTLVSPVMILTDERGKQYMEYEARPDNVRSTASFPLLAGHPIHIHSVDYVHEPWMVTSFIPTARYRDYVCALVSFRHQGREYENVLFEWTTPSKLYEYRQDASLQHAENPGQLRRAPWEAADTPAGRSIWNRKR